MARHHGCLTELTGQFLTGRHFLQIPGQQAYLGETWDYVIETADGTRLRVSTPPDVSHEVGRPWRSTCPSALAASSSSKRQLPLGPTADEKRSDSLLSRATSSGGSVTVNSASSMPR